MRGYRSALREDARAALQIIADLPPSRAVEALLTLLEGVLTEHFWFNPRAREQLQAELINFVFLARKREKITESFVFWRFLRIVQDLMRDGLAIPRKETPGGLLLEEGEALDALLSSLALKGDECTDKSLSGQKPRKPGVRHKAAERALFLALRERRHLSGQREKCPDTNLSGQKVRQGRLFQFSAGWKVDSLSGQKVSEENSGWMKNTS